MLDHQRSRLGRCAVAVAAAACATVLFGGVAANAAPESSVDSTTVDPVDAGAVAFVDASNPTSVLSEGDNTTVFNLRIPDGATCPGDSANDNWRVQSFILPATDDPGATTYDVIRPNGGGPRHAVYSVDTRPYVHVLTEQNPGPGLPGRILATPPLTFAVFPPGTLPDGNYRVGLACTLFRETAVYWDAELVVSSDPQVDPGGMRWQLATASVGDASTSAVADAAPGTSATWIVVGLGVLAAAGAALILRRRHTTSPRTLAKELP